MKNLPIILALLFLCISCNNSQSNKNEQIDNSLDVSVDDKPGKKVEDVVFYNVFYPVDLDKIITENNGYYSSSYLNNVNNITKYSQSHKIALNIGIYGADLSYLWIFDQSQQALTYLASIQHLTDKLGIPQDYVDFTQESIMENSHSMDSVANIARDAYSATDKYLKDIGNESASILVLLGGWIETLYIATQMYNKPDAILASKIATQKYSLNSLLTQLQNYQDDLIIAEYIVLLRKLKEEFNIFEKQLKPGDIEIDTVKKQITIKENSNLQIEPEQLNEIKTITKKIRQHIIN